MVWGTRGVLMVPVTTLLGELLMPFSVTIAVSL